MALLEGTIYNFYVQGISLVTVRTFHRIFIIMRNWTRIESDWSSFAIEQESLFLSYQCYHIKKMTEMFVFGTTLLKINHIFCGA